MLDSNPTDDVGSGESFYFIDNKYNMAPKIMAEANRHDGFTIFGIDYMMDRAPLFDYDQVIQETIIENGWTQYISENKLIDIVTPYVPDKLPMNDNSVPQWTSTAAVFNQVVEPRVGVQTVVPGATSDSMIVRWDSTKDQSPPIKYNIYLSTTPDFANPTVHRAVQYETGEGWYQDPINNVANQYTIAGLTSNTYYVRVRAEDSSPSQLEETNMVTLSLDINTGPVEPPVYANPISGITIDGNLNDWVGLVWIPMRYQA